MPYDVHLRVILRVDDAENTEDATVLAQEQLREMFDHTGTHTYRCWLDSTKQPKTVEADD
jgi:hypothetical protein